MSTKPTKAMRAPYRRQKGARDPKVISRPLKTEIHRLRNALIQIADLCEGDEPAMIALKALGGSNSDVRPAGRPRYTLSQLLAECEEAGGLPVLQMWDTAHPVGFECLEPNSNEASQCTSDKHMKEISMAFPFDTLKYSETLIAAGVPSEQARTQTTALIAALHEFETYLSEKHGLEPKTAGLSKVTNMRNETMTGFLKGVHRTWRYGYFAPLTALTLSAQRRGSYLWHLRALYRLTFWRGQMYT